MKIGKTNPIRFWLNGEQVFNESLKDYMHPQRFKQPWKPDDNIVIQLFDNAERGIKLEIRQNNIITATLDFNRIPYRSGYVYQLSFRVGDYITSGDFRLFIIEEFNEITGSIIDGDEVTGDIFNASLITISGSVTDGDDAYGNITHNLFSQGMFGLNPTPCLYNYELYWAHSTPWGTGVTIYTDSTLTTVLSSSFTVICYELEGQHYAISSGVVGSPLGIYC